MYDELYAAGARQIVGAVPQYAAGMVPQYAAGMVPQFAAGGREIVGAALQRAYAAGAAAAMAQLQNGQPTGNAIAYGQHLGVANRGEPDARLWPLPISQAAIPASGSATATARPQELFRVQKLSVSAAVGANFVMTDIRVGQRSQLVQAGDLDCDSFLPTAVGTMITFDTCEKGCDFAISVRNTDALNPHDFKATVFGAVAR